MQAMLPLFAMLAPSLWTTLKSVPFPRYSLIPTLPQQQWRLTFTEDGDTKPPFSLQRATGGDFYIKLWLRPKQVSGEATVATVVLAQARLPEFVCW